MADTSILDYGTATRRNAKTPANIRSYDERRIIDFVMNRAHEASDGEAFKKLKDNYDSYRRAYNGQYKNLKDIPKWRNRLFVRLSFKVVETLRAYFMDALFRKEPYTYVSPTNFLWNESAKNMQASLQYHAERVQKARKYMNVINYALKHGVAVTRSFWNFQRSIKPVRQFVRDQNGFIRHYDEVEQWYVKMDSPDFQVKDPVKVAFDPLHWITGEMRYAIEEDEVDFDTLWNSKEFYGYENLDAVERESRLGGGGPGISVGILNTFGTDPHSESDYIGTLREISKGGTDFTRKRINLIRYEGKLDMPGNQEDPRYYEVLIANQNHVILVNKMPYSFDRLSYNIHNIIPQDDSYAGIGAIEPILTDQWILNILCNIRLDSLSLLISPRIIAYKNAFESGIDNIANIAPGGILGVKQMSDISRAIMPLNMPDQGFNTFHQFWEMQNRHAEETLAMHPNATGMLAPGARSATETVRSLEAANARFMHMVDVFARTGYNDQVSKESAMIQQLQTEEMWIKITGDPKAGTFYRNIMPWDLQGEFMFDYNDPTKSSGEQEAQLWANLLTVFAPYFQMLQPYGISPLPFLKGVLESSPIFNKLDIAKSMPSAEPRIEQFLNSENTRLDQAIVRMDAARAPASPGMNGAGTMPGGGMAAGAPMTQPQPEGTAAGIMMGGF